MKSHNESMVMGRIKDGQVELAGPLRWPEGAVVEIRMAAGQVKRPPARRAIPGVSADGGVIVAGFGLAGRAVVECLESMGAPYTLIESNPETVLRQRGLGRSVIEGDAGEEAVLRSAGIERASILALAMPDEEAVMRAIGAARGLRPDLYIIARTHYTSSGLRALELGADDVIKAEHSVAMDFQECLHRRLAKRAAIPPTIQV